MFAYSYKKLKALIELMSKDGSEPEITIYFRNNDNAYMIICYANKYSFQRCGFDNGSGEWYYNNLDELYSAVTVDDIVLKRDWDKIIKINSPDYVGSNDDFMHACCDFYSKNQ